MDNTTEENDNQDNNSFIDVLKTQAVVSGNQRETQETKGGSKEAKDEARVYNEETK